MNKYQIIEKVKTELKIIHTTSIKNASIQKLIDLGIPYLNLSPVVEYFIVIRNKDTGYVGTITYKDLINK